VERLLLLEMVEDYQLEKFAHSVVDVNLLKVNVFAMTISDFVNLQESTVLLIGSIHVNRFCATCNVTPHSCPHI